MTAAVARDGTGIFYQTPHIQWVNTVGGLAPSTLGAFRDWVAEVPNTTEYYFYCAED
jgi:hypothetical protein